MFSPKKAWRKGMERPIITFLYPSSFDIPCSIFVFSNFRWERPPLWSYLRPPAMQVKSLKIICPSLHTKGYNRT